MNRDFILEIKASREGKTKEQLKELKKDMLEMLSYKYNDPLIVESYLAAMGLLWI
jgi:hypothetical protein